jgi:hypothetical protein
MVQDTADEERATLIAQLQERPALAGKRTSGLVRPL